MRWRHSYHKTCYRGLEEICSPTQEGGLGLRSIRSINEVALLKLSWDLFSAYTQWTLFLKARLLRNSNPIARYVKSSVGFGARQFLPIGVANNIWSIGDGKKSRFLEG